MSFGFLANSASGKVNGSVKSPADSTGSEAVAGWDPDAACARAAGVDFAASSGALLARLRGPHCPSGNFRVLTVTTTTRRIEQP